MKRKFSRILGVVAVVALLASFLSVPVSADVGKAAVSVDDPEISATSEYIITFGVTDEVPLAGSIEIRFPEGTIVTDNAGDLEDTGIRIKSTAGFGTLNDGTKPILGANVLAEEDDDVWTVTIVLLDLANPIGEDARVRVTFAAALPALTTIENPDTPGDYSLEVRTSEEDKWVESEEYEIEIPEIPVLPGVLELYNPSDILMASFTGSTAVQDALLQADEGWTIKIGEGEYTESPNTSANDVTIEGSGDIEDIVIIGSWYIGNTDITLDNLTLDGDEGNVPTLLDVDANDLTVQDCVLQYAGTALINDWGSAADYPTIIDDCTFNVEDEIGISANADAAEITDCTFNVEEDGAGVGIEINASIDVSDCTFIGDDSGIGVEVNASDSEISGCTFDGLTTAFDIDGGIADINTNTIQNCDDIAITVATCTEVTIHNNTITGNDVAALIEVDVLADAELVYMMFNTITDNAGDDGLLIDNDDATADLECRLNWWGDPDGPGDDAFSDDVESEPFLPGPIANSAIEAGVLFGETADFEDACGVTVRATARAVSVDPAPMAIVGGAQYAANPVAAISNAVGFWDVAVIEPDANIDEITVKLYTDVTEDTEVYVWGEARGEWLECDNYIPNLFAGYVGIVVTDTTTPTIDDLGLPFVVVEPGPAAAEAPEISAPVVGAVDVSVTPTLAWEAVADATYEVQIAQDATFGILDEAATSPTNAYIVTTALAEGQSYYWRVRAVTDAGAGDWATGVFTTATPEPEPTPPIIIEETEPPEITVEIPQQVTQAIDPGLLWAIVGVGAVLVISLIVLIIRTRRAV